MKRKQKRVGCKRSVTFMDRTIDQLTREPTDKEKQLMELCVADVRMQAGSSQNVVTQFKSNKYGNTMFTAWEQLEVKAEVDPFMEGGFVTPTG